MTAVSQHLPGRQPFAAVKRLASRAAAVVAERYRAQRRLAVLAASPDRYLRDAGLTPGTYQEFLFRTSGALAHEPAAATRLTGRMVL